MSSLSYGLNITKKAGPAKPAPARRKPIFGEDDSDGDDDGASKADAVEEIGEFGDGDSKAKKPNVKLQNGGKANGKPPTSLYGDLSSSHGSKKHATEAKQLDPSIYDYDAAYESLHAATSKKAAAADDKKPRYMASLLAAAEVRKRDQLRAKDKLLAKEREAEGDEYADKEKFVTGAYKAQQEEVRKLEEEERIREEEERRKNKGRGMVGFYRSVLDREEKKHEEAVTAAAAAVPSDAGEEQAYEEKEKEKTEADVARELKARGRDVTINDEGQIVDKRQLLSAGLNMAPRPKPPPASPSSSGRAPTGSTAQAGVGGAQTKAATQRAMRERQTRMLEEQLAQATKRAADDDEAERARVAERAVKTRKTDGEISSARERYLQRKREAEEAEEAKKAKKKG